MSSTKSPINKQGQQSIVALAFALFTANFLVYGVGRITFWLWNHRFFENLASSDLLLVFLQGARFDAAIAAIVTFLMFWIFVIFKSKVLRNGWLTALVMGHAVLILANFVDCELVHFVGRRMTRSSLYLVGEGNITNLMRYFPMTIVTFFSLGLFIWTHYKIAKYFNPILKTRMQTGLVIFSTLLLTAFFVRGGWQEKPLSFVDSKIIAHPMAHHLILNTPFSVLKSWGQKNIERNHYFNKEKMLSFLNHDSSLDIQPATTELGRFKNKNLVIFILESFSAEYIRPQTTPFLYELMSRSDQTTTFLPAYANGRRSIEGIAAILSGVPALMEEPFVNSEFATNDVVGLGNVFKKKNYRTQFFHGAKNGSMRFDLYTKAIGFDEYYGLNEFPDPKQNDGAWGIWDQPFFNWMCTQIPTQDPFASVVFSLSSHQPFQVPKDFIATVPADAAPILKTVQYTDQALKSFFDCAEKQPWYQQTLFLLVADHTGPELSSAADFKSRYEIMMLFIDPSKNLKINSKQYAQQIDVLPTLNDLFDLNIQGTNHLGRSLLNPGRKTIALYSDQKYELVGDTDLSDDRLKAIRQYFSEAMYDNRLYYPAIKE